MLVRGAVTGLALCLLASCSLVEEEDLREPGVVTVAPLPAGDDPVLPDPTVPTSEPCATLLAVDDPANDTLADAEVAERYEAIVDLVPDSLRVDLILVIAGLRSEAVDIPEREIVMEETTATRPTVAPDQTSADAPTTTERVDVDPEVLEALETEPDAEGRSIPLLPVERIAAYVDEVCRGTSNNPGPPPGTVVSGPDT